MLAYKEKNEPFRKSGKSPTALSSLHQGTQLKYKANWLISGKKKISLKRRGNKVSSCTHQSDLPFCMEPVGPKG